MMQKTVNYSMKDVLQMLRTVLVVDLFPESVFCKFK